MADDAHSLRGEITQLCAVATLLCVGTLYLFWPLLGSVSPAGFDHVVGDANTDALRGLWGLDHIRRSLLPPDLPFASAEIGFPAGTVGLVLPTATSTLLAPVELLLGPVHGWNLATALLLWGTALATATLVRRLSGSWPAGLAAGGAMLAQPSLLHALGDGTAELLAFWSVPLLLATTHEALRGRGGRWGLAAGLVAVVLALDSPYYAVFATTLGLIVLPWSLAAGLRRRDWRALFRSLLPLLAVAGCGALLLAWLSRSFPLDESVVSDGLSSLRGRNSVDLSVWWYLDQGLQETRDPSLAPAMIPSITVGVALVLAVVGAPRSLPWLLAAALSLVLALGLDPDNPTWLGNWFGPAGTRAGEQLLALNRALYALPGISGIRFPNRWLTATALGLATGGGIGLARVLSLLRRAPGGRLLAWPVAAGLAAGAVLLGVARTHLHTPFPAHDVPRPAFAEWIADQPGGGAVVTLPRMRPAPQSGKRADVEVFADLDPVLASADLVWFQVVHRRAMVDAPDLQTLGVHPPSDDVVELLRYWDDAWRQAGGADPHQHHPDPRDVARRGDALASLVDEGLRFVVVDRGVYGDTALQRVEDQLGDHLEARQDFDEGAGVTVLVLGGD